MQSTLFPLQDLSEEDMAAILKQFFTSVNHYLPIFISEKRLQDRLSIRKESSVESVCASAIVACAAAYNERNEVAERAIQHALDTIDWRLFGEASLFSVQIILAVIVGLGRLQIHDQLVSNLLATASRMIFSLGLHRLSEVTDISLEERLEKLQIYWSVFILDKEYSMRYCVPPGIPDDEVDVLGIEPPRTPLFGSGMVQPLTGARVLSLFTARQRLARIGGRIWKDLYTSRARVQPSRLQRETAKHLNEQLQKWKEEWFEVESDLARHWPNSAIDHVINLQCTYFEFVLKANPEVLTSAVDVVYTLQKDRRPVEPPQTCLDAARNTLRMIRFRGTREPQQIR